MKCCMNCVAPKRHPGCHGKCKDYIIEREELDVVNEKAKKDRDVYYTIKGLNILRAKSRKR